MRNIKDFQDLHDSLGERVNVATIFPYDSRKKVSKYKGKLVSVKEWESITIDDMVIPFISEDGVITYIKDQENRYIYNNKKILSRCPIDKKITSIASLIAFSFGIDHSLKYLNALRNKLAKYEDNKEMERFQKERNAKIQNR